MVKIMVFYKCIECGCIYIKKVEICDGCRESESEFENLDELEIEDVVNLIRDYEWRRDNTYSDFVDYMDVFDYIVEYIGDEACIMVDKAFKIAEDRNIAIKKEIVYFPDQ